MISNQIKKMKFVNAVIAAFNEKVGPLVDCGMHFDASISIAEKILTTTKLNKPLQGPHTQKEF